MKQSKREEPFVRIQSTRQPLQSSITESGLFAQGPDWDHISHECSRELAGIDFGWNAMYDMNENLIDLIRTMHSVMLPLYPIYLYILKYYFF